MLAEATETRAQLVTEFEAGRQRTAELFSVLKPSYLYERPIAQRNRVIFYVGHLENFDYLQLCRACLGESSHDTALDSLFQAGIDPDSKNLPSDTPADWPSLDQVHHYTSECCRAVDRALELVPEEAIAMVVEHRLMHLETLAYMWHNFDHKAKVKPAASELEQMKTSPGHVNEWCSVPAGTAILGKPRDGSFGWDNEYGEDETQVPAFAVQKFKVTNGEYLQFVRSGAAKPHFWTEKAGHFYLRGMFEEIPLPLDWPVYVTQQEAAAYAAWLGKSLLTETQYHRAAFGTPSGETRPHPWGAAYPSSQHGNFDFRRWEPEPVQATPAGASAFGVRQVSGNGWEWTATPFRPLPGFQPMPAYPAYSANFFDDHHYVIKGGSPRTGARLLRRSFRNWFRPDYPYLYATFRCVEN
jgi:gamma-glutamyl hercynylcysteine S-oxide synthase